MAYKAAAFAPEAIKMSANENPLGSSPKAVKRIQDMATRVFQYPDGNNSALKEALAKKYLLSADNFIIGNGSDELFTLIAHVYMQEGCYSITAESTFSEYSFATRIFGGEMIFCPLKQGKFDLDAIAKAVSSETRLIFLCNPNNPTGTYFSHQELSAFMKKIPENVLVILDEAYADFMDCADRPDHNQLLSDFSNIIILRTFSKIYGLAGLRIGYAMANQAIINDLNRVREPFNCNSIAQEAAIAALGDHEFIDQTLCNNQRGKEFLYGQLDSLGLTYYPSQGNFICLNVKHNGQAVFEALLNQGIVIRPLGSFGLNTWIRITIGQPEDNRFFIHCLRGFLEKNSEDIS